MTVPCWAGLPLCPVPNSQTPVLTPVRYQIYLRQSKAALYVIEFP